MIKSYNGFKAERTAAKETLPAGGYVAKIMDASVIKYDWGEVLKIDFDIAEGEYKGFFTTALTQVTIRSGAETTASTFRTRTISILTARERASTT